MGGRPVRELSDKLTEAERRKALREWSGAPSVNPRYKGATPADMVRALRGKAAAPQLANPPPVKTNL